MISLPHESKFNIIHVIDSMPGGELNTVRVICEDLRTLAASTGFLTVEKHKVESKTELWGVFERIADHSRQYGSKPLIHFEAHGDADLGVQLKSEQFVRWWEFIPALTDANVAAKNNLVLHFAMCSGGYLASILAKVINKRSPFSALVAPTEDVGAGPMSESFVRYYHKLIADSSLAAAIGELNRNPDQGKYGLWTCEKLFVDTWIPYLQKMCTPEKRFERAKMMASKKALEGLDFDRALVDFGRELLPANHGPAFRRSMQHFLMTDLYPDNNFRYPITFEDVYKQALHEV